MDTYALLFFFASNWRILLSIVLRLKRYLGFIISLTDVHECCGSIFFTRGLLALENFPGRVSPLLLSSRGIYPAASNYPKLLFFFQRLRVENDITMKVFNGDFFRREGKFDNSLGLYEDK